MSDLFSSLDPNPHPEPRIGDPFGSNVVNSSAAQARGNRRVDQAIDSVVSFGQRVREASGFLNTFIANLRGARSGTIGPGGTSTTRYSIGNNNGNNGGSGGNGDGGGRPPSFMSSFLPAIFNTMGGAIANRIDRGYNYSLSADKMNVMYQQMSGMSQVAVQNQYRSPLTNYRLGGGDAINQMLQLQASTGLSAANQASSMEALRAVSGYGLSVGDTTSMARALASPQVANRMYMTMGFSMYGIGGKENSVMSVIQRMVQSAGLMNPQTAKTALQPGSATRMRLKFMGLPEDMQDTVIQYAIENNAYRSKGGTGMYDPSREQDRRIMGIEGNFATQKEKTDQLKMLREENFYSRQNDNFASLEKQTQALTKAFGALEEKLSGLVGGSISSGSTGRLFGGLGMAAGMGLTMAGQPWLGLPLMLLSTVFGGSVGPRGDGDTGGRPTGVKAGGATYPTYNKPKTLSQIQGSSSFSQMHPKLKERVTRMIVASGGRVGFGEGKRSSAQQENMFRQRYVPATSESEADVHWNGQGWKHVSGAAAAPPGRSMHEIGLAADLTGDMEWVKQNASRFNLRSFHDVNNEPWHVQPAELPGSRLEYEKQGAAWGTDGKGKAVTGYTNAVEGETYGGGSPQSSGYGVATYSGTETLRQVLDSALSSNYLSGGGGGGGLSSHEVSTRGAGNRNYSTSESVNVKTGGKQISASGMVALLRRHGYKGSDLYKALGVTWRESSWNPGVLNPKNRDLSYGLFQINMKGALGPDRRKRYHLSSNEQLYDPDTNVRVAKEMLDAGHGSWWPWQSGGSELNGWKSPITDMSKAAAVVNSVDRSGDPMPNMASRAGSTTVVHGGNNITISPVINITGGSDIYNNLQFVSREIGRLLKNEVDIAMLRSS